MLDLLGNLPAVLGIIAAIVVAFFGWGLKERHKGRKEGADKIRTKAEKGAQKRKDIRDEVDSDTDDAGAARDSMRKRWTADE